MKILIAEDDFASRKFMLRFSSLPSSATVSLLPSVLLLIFSIILYSFSTILYDFMRFFVHRYYGA